MKMLPASHERKAIQAAIRLAQAEVPRVGRNTHDTVHP
jgi:hypothetical protein